MSFDIVDSQAAARQLAAAHPGAWPDALPVLDALTTRGHDAFLVGGTVRDVLLGRSPGDPDIATDAIPERMMEFLPNPKPTGLRHGTVTSVVNGEHI
ncbi:MAG TPA: hypothetical protein VF720_09420, partial [Candidatus Eisenbacteria bacterium]